MLSASRMLAPVVVCLGFAPDAARAQMISPVDFTLTAQSASVDTMPVPLPRTAHLSDAYATRLTIHRTASYLLLPLFAVQYASGRSLYNSTGTGDDKGWARDVHGPTAAAIEGLFVVNGVTGVWNLLDLKKAHAGSTRSTVHALLMLTSAAGFAATAALAPDDDEAEGDGGSNKSTHRTVALTSVATALAGYSLMLLWKD